MPEYITLIKTNPPEFQQARERLSRITQRPQEDIEVHGIWSTLGSHDLLVAYNAPEQEKAMQFIQNKVNGVGIRSTQTLSGQALSSFTPGYGKD